MEGAKPARGPALTSTHVKPNLGPRSRKRRERKLKMKGAFRDPPPGPPCGTDLCVMAARSPPATPEAIDVLNFMPTVTLFFFTVFPHGCAHPEPEVPVPAAPESPTRGPREAASMCRAKPRRRGLTCHAATGN